VKSESIRHLGSLHRALLDASRIQGRKTLSETLGHERFVKPFWEFARHAF
jgi:hypothetical protein